MDGPTSSSFLQSLATGKPLSSHGPSAAPSLQRGQACKACRTRKIRCDGQRPACGACLKSAKAHGDKLDDIVCDYEPASRKRPRTSNTKDEQSHSPAAPSQQASGSSDVPVLDVAHVNYLEQRVRDLEAQLAARAPDGLPLGQGYQIRQPISQAYELPPFRAATAPQFSGHSLEALLEASNSPIFSTAAPTTAHFVQDDLEGHVGVDPMLWQMLSSGWPADLPKLSMCRKLIEGWLARTQDWEYLLRPTRILASLTFPVNHPQFPSKALIHALLAEATETADPAVYEGEKYWAPHPDATSYHAACASLCLQEDISRARNIITVIQAGVMLCHRAYKLAKYVEVWTLCGLVTRLCAPADLNHVQATDEAIPASGFEQRLVKRTVSLLPPTDDPQELAERCAVFWSAFQCDRLATASTGWALSLDEADVTTPLPARDGSMPSGNPTLSPLCISNPNFLISHPSRLVGPKQLCTKAIILIGRVASFLSRSPAPVGRGLPNAQAVGDYRDSPGFRKMESDVINFRMSIPAEFRLQSAKANVDYFYCIPLNALPHVCIILLHEIFCTGAQDTDHSFEACVNAARAVLQGIHAVHNTSFDISVTTPFVMYLWAVAGRTLVRELAIRQLHGNYDNMHTLRADIELVITTMRGHRTPLGDNCASQLQSLYEDPDVCLPRPLVERSEISTYGLPEEMQAARRPRPANANGPPATVDWANFLSGL